MSLAFAQTGTVDWTSLTSMTISTPITLMSRLAQSGVDQYTIELVKFYGQFLNLPSDYLSVVESGLIQARKFGLSADVLFVGTGISLIPPMLAKTRGGVAFAAVIMALRASFPANFTARVLSEWLRFFDRPPEISIPSTSQLQALSNEVAACPIDPEIGRIIWGIEKLHEEAAKTNGFYLTNPTAAPPAQDLAAAIYAITTIRPGQDAIIKFRSSQGPSPVWLAAFASKVVGLGVSYEIGSKVIWEQPEKHCAISGPRGRLRLLIEELSSKSNHTNNYQLLKSASIQLILQRHEEKIQTSFRISPKLVVDRLLENMFNSPGQREEAMNCIGKAAYHLSRKPALWSLPLAPGSSLAQYPLTRNGVRSALLMIGASTHNLDEWEAEAEAEAEAQVSNMGGDGWKGDVFENNLRDHFGAPFIASFKKIDEANQKNFLDNKIIYLLPWSRSCLETLQVALTIWTVLAFVSPIDQNGASLDGRAGCRIIEESGTISRSQLFRSMWMKIPYNLNGSKISYYNDGNIKKAYNLDFYDYFSESQPSCLLNISAVHEAAFGIIGGHFNDNPELNISGITTGGTFIIMSTLLEPNRQGPKDASIIFVGQGGIFINQQATPILESFDSGKDVPAMALDVSPELEGSSYVQEIRKYTTGAESCGDLTQTHLDMSLYTTGGPDVVSLSWSVRGRQGPDIMIDALLSPHRILRAILDTYSIEQLRIPNDISLGDKQLDLPESTEQRDTNFMNLETFLAMKHKTPNYNKLIMAQKNPYAQLLAMVYWPYSTDFTTEKEEEGEDFASKALYLCPSEQLANFLPRIPSNSTVIVS